MNFKELKELIQSGQDLRSHTEWGFYPILYISDGSILCAACAQSDIEKHLAGEHVHRIEDLGCDIYYEGSTFTCDDCGDELASAYGDPDTKCLNCGVFDHPEHPVYEVSIGADPVLLCESCDHGLRDEDLEEIGENHE